ncbi:MAG: hypothetical protein ACLTW9_27105 [Enterocloster sp.]
MKYSGTDISYSRPGNRLPCRRCPVLYYHSREIKELGMETVKVNNSRTMGVLSDSTVYVIYYTGDCAMKWSYNTELS